MNKNFIKIALKPEAEDYVPSAIWEANLEDNLYLVEDLGTGTSFIGNKRPDGTLGICTHVATSDVIRK